jgi:hypothetical protein
MRQVIRGKAYDMPSRRLDGPQSYLRPLASLLDEPQDDLAVALAGPAHGLRRSRTASVVPDEGWATDARHHHAVQVIFVGGSPEPLRHSKPGPYPVKRREQWRPRTKPPNRKGEAVKRLLDEFRRQDEVVRSMLTPSAARLTPESRQALATKMGSLTLPAG